MATFEDIAHNSDAPIIHAYRKDGTTIIATRIPLDDVRLDRWGWILTLSYKDRNAEQDDLETLKDNAGRMYPKIYTLNDVQNYAEKWACTDWQAGYQGNEDTTTLEISTTKSELLQRDFLRDTFTEISARQERIVAIEEEILEVLEEQTVNTGTKLSFQLTSFNEEIDKQANLLNQKLETQIRQSQETIVQTVEGLTSNEGTSKRFDLLDQKLEMQTQQTQAKVIQTIEKQAFDSSENVNNQVEKLHEEIKNQSLLIQRCTFDVVQAQSSLACEEANKHLEMMSEEVKNYTSLAQKNTLEALEAQFVLARSETQNYLHTLYEDIAATLASYSIQIKDLQEQIKQALDALDPEVEDDSEKAENSGTTAAMTKTVRKVTTQIERIAANQQKMSMNYYNSTNEQAKQGFRLAWMLSVIGAAIFSTTVLAAVVMTSLHLYGYTALLGAIGVIGTAIVTTMGGLSSFQARTAKQFMRSHQLLDRSYRPTIAHAMCIGYTDEDRKQGAIDKIIDGLLKNDE